MWNGKTPRENVTSPKIQSSRICILSMWNGKTPRENVTSPKIQSSRQSGGIPSPFTTHK